MALAWLASHHEDGKPEDDDGRSGRSDLGRMFAFAAMVEQIVPGWLLLQAMMLRPQPFMRVQLSEQKAADPDDLSVFTLPAGVDPRQVLEHDDDRAFAVACLFPLDHVQPGPCPLLPSEASDDTVLARRCVGRRPDEPVGSSLVKRYLLRCGRVGELRVGNCWPGWMADRICCRQLSAFVSLDMDQIDGFAPVPWVSWHHQRDQTTRCRYGCMLKDRTSRRAARKASRRARVAIRPLW